MLRTARSTAASLLGYRLQATQTIPRASMSDQTFSARIPNAAVWDGDNARPGPYLFDPALGYHPPVVPLDLKLGLTKPAHPGDKPLRWGILACGKVAHDFTQVLHIKHFPMRNIAIYFVSLKERRCV